MSYLKHLKSEMGLENYVESNIDEAILAHNDCSAWFQEWAEKVELELPSAICFWDLSGKEAEKAEKKFWFFVDTHFDQFYFWFVKNKKEEYDEILDKLTEDYGIVLADDMQGDGPED